MCGIAGVFDPSGRPIEPGLMVRMISAMRHRGPDDEGFFEDGGLALGFRRLSIVDLSGGHQPMTTDCGRFTIVFNGEIYNHRNCAQILERITASASARARTPR